MRLHSHWLGSLALEDDCKDRSLVPAVVVSSDDKECIMGLDSVVSRGDTVEPPPHGSTVSPLDNIVVETGIVGN